MNKESIRNKIHELVDKIEDESALNILKEDAEVYIKSDSALEDNLTTEQWETIEAAKAQIKNGQHKTYAEVKAHFAQWFAK